MRYLLSAIMAAVALGCALLSYNLFTGTLGALGTWTLLGYLCLQGMDYLHDSFVVLFGDEEDELE